MSTATASSYLKRLGLICCALITVLAELPACGQFTTVLNIPPDPNIGNSQSVGSETQVNVFEGGTIGFLFRVGASGITNTELELNVFGGSVGSSLRAYDGATINITGGMVGGSFNAYDGSTVLIFGGSVGTSTTANAGSFVGFSGGRIDRFFTARAGSTVTLSGGTFGDGFAVNAGATLSLEGYDFLLDSVPIAGLDTVGQSAPFLLPTGAVLTGIAADGTPFAFSSFDGDDLADGTLTLVRSDEPAMGPAVINLPGDVPPLGVRARQTLVLASGGTLPADFSAGRGSVVDIMGGEIGNNFEAAGAEINISSGRVGERFDAFAASSVNISGGIVGHSFDVYDGSTLNVSGGTIGQGLHAYPGSTVNITGGAVGRTFNVHKDSLVDFSGGVVGAGLTAHGGANLILSGGNFGDGIHAAAGASLIIEGFDFRFNNVPVAGLETVGQSVAFDLPQGGVLTGILADGAPFMFASFDGDDLAQGTLTLTRRDETPVGPAVIELASSQDTAPQGIRAGQMLIVRDSGAVPKNFGAAQGSVVRITGGSVDENLEAVGAEVNISGGRVSPGFDAVSGTTLNVSGGNLRGNVDVARGSHVTITGGNFGDDFDVAPGSTATIHGFDFAVDGQPLAGLQSVGQSAPFDLPDNALLTGVLADSTPFAFTSADSDEFAAGSLTLVRSPEVPRGPDIIHLPGDPVPHGLRAGQTLIVETSAVSFPDDFVAAAGSRVQLSGLGRRFSATGRNFEAIASDVNIRDSLVAEDFDAFLGSRITIIDSDVSNRFEAHTGSVVKIFASHIFSDFQVSSGATADIVDSEVRDDVTANSGAVLNLIATSRFSHDSRVFGQVIANSQSTVNVLGGEVGGFAAHTESTINIFDGAIGGDSVVDSGATVNVIGGNVGGSITVNADGVLNVLNGAIQGRTPDRPLTANAGSTVNIAGGVVQGALTANAGSVVNVTGGMLDSFIGFSVNAGATVNFSGGSFIRGGRFSALAESTVNLFGNSFLMDDVQVPGLDNPGDSVVITAENDAALSVILLDGSQMSFLLGVDNPFTDGIIHHDAVLRLTLGSFVGLSGDANRDGLVNIDDLNAVRNNFGAAGAPDGTLPGDSYPFDGLVNIDDLNAVRNNFGAASPVAPVPEPASAALALLATIAFVLPRNR